MKITRFIMPYGWTGLVIMTVAEILLFSGNSAVKIWMTPLMWTGFILAVDNIVYRRAGKSMLTLSRMQILVIMIISIGSWLIFEGYNVYIRNWKYINLPESLPVRYIGYAWAFATITPGILLTADLLKTYGVFEKFRSKPRKIPNRLLAGMLIAGGFMSFYPLFFPNEYLFPLVWCGYIFLIDPLNYILGGRSLLADLFKGDPSNIYRLLLAGAICGILWEFWNYWAGSKWVYTVPYFPEYKIFEMPVAGYIGFPPFAIECYVLYHFFRAILKKAGFTLRYE